MTDRIDPYAAAPEQMKMLIQYSIASGAGGIEAGLAHLVKIRASQINGCAICLHMHAEEARKGGETDDRIILLDAWREAGLYTPREMAALEWTEALTLIAENTVPDELYEAVRAHFSERELAELTMAIIAINGWNRIAISTRMEPGHYQSRLTPEMSHAAS